jgi:predicted nucleotidyltransferase
MSLNLPAKYMQDIENALVLLKNEGCQSVFLFGSLATGKYHEGSDIDIGVKGLSPKKYFRVSAQLDKILENKFDFVDFDLNNDMFTLLNSLGEVIKLG